LLNKLVDANKIAKNVRLMSDSGWECGASDIDGPSYLNANEKMLYKHIVESKVQSMNEIKSGTFYS